MIKIKNTMQSNFVFWDGNVFGFSPDMGVVPRMLLLRKLKSLRHRWLRQFPNLTLSLG